jgi:hypothetical protein
MSTYSFHYFIVLHGSLPSILYRNQCALTRGRAKPPVRIRNSLKYSYYPDPDPRVTGKSADRVSLHDSVLDANAARSIQFLISIVAGHKCNNTTRILAAYCTRGHVTFLKRENRLFLQILGVCKVIS